MMDATSPFACSPDVIWDDVDGVLTLCETVSGELFTFNETGAIIWKACAANSSFDGILEELTVAYPDEGSDRLTMELNEFIRDLLKSGLLVGEEHPEGILCQSE